MHASVTAILPGEPVLAGFPLILPIHTSSLTPSHRVFLRHEKDDSGGTGEEGNLALHYGAI